MQNRPPHRIFTELRSQVILDYAALHNFRRVAEEWDSTPGTVNDIYRGQEPTEMETRLHFGLEVLAPAPVCPVHGVVHVGRCPRGSQAKRLRDLPLRELKKLFEERKEL